jgi:hypothetical protein
MNNNTPNNYKDVIYVDVDDEITAIIDKVRSSEQRIVALVLPKRATMMQSIVNMKLLKRSAESAKKHVVLITSEVGLLPLAAGVGIRVAKSLQSRPEVPVVAGVAPGVAADDDEDAVDMNNLADQPLDKKQPIAAYAGPLTGTDANRAGGPDDEDPIDFDNTAPAAAGIGMGSLASKKGASKPDSKLKIPNFNKFRLWLVIGGVAILVIGVLTYVALAVMPKATIAIKTDSEAIDTNIGIGLDTEAATLDLEDMVVPAEAASVQKSAAQTVDATGSINKGERASGQITLKNCSKSDNPIVIPAGSGFSSDGMTFISQASVSVPDSNYSGGGNCKNDGSGQNTVTVIAQKAGAAYNLSARAYAIANGLSNVTAKGTDMSGGTDVIVKTVQQADIDAAKQKIVSDDASAIKLELTQKLEDQNLFVIDDTFRPGDAPEVTTDVPVGTEAEKVTVTAKTTYTLLGASQDDLKKVIKSQVDEKIDTKRQDILDYGLDEANFRVESAQATATTVTLQATSIAGTDINLNDVKKQVAGKKANDAKEIINAYPGVTNVDVKYSPFWVKSIPGNTAKITITVEKPSSTDAD